MIVGVVRIELHLHGVTSLKQKRSLVSRLLSRLRGRFPVSLAEVGALDAHQRAIFGGAMVAADEALINKMFGAIETELEKEGSGEVMALDTELIHYGEIDR